MEIVSFEIAKKLKEKGYPQKWQNVLAFYNESGDCFSLCPTTSNVALFYTGNPFKLEQLVAPTISQVLKWLREEKKIHIMINFWPAGYDAEIFTEIGKDRNSFCWERYIDECDFYDSYELAALAGVEYVMDNLI